MSRTPLILTAFAALAVALPATGGPAVAATNMPTAAQMVDAASRAKATAAFTALKKRTPDADVVWKTGQPGAHVVVGLAEKAKGKDLVAKAKAFIDANKHLVGIDGGSVRFLATSRSKRRVVVRFQQVHRGIEVVDRLVAVRMDPDGTIVGLVSDAMPVGKLAKARLSADDAKKAAADHARRHFRMRHLGMRHLDASKLRAKQVILAAPGRAIIGFVVEVAAVPMRAHMQLIVSATSGRIVQSRNHVQH